MCPVAVCCSALQCVAVCCSVLQYKTVSLFRRVSKGTGSSTCYYTRKSCEKVSSRENFNKQRTTILKYSALDTSSHHTHTYEDFNVHHTHTHHTRAFHVHPHHTHTLHTTHIHFTPHTYICVWCEVYVYVCGVKCMCERFSCAPRMQTRISRACTPHTCAQCFAASFLRGSSCRLRFIGAIHYQGFFRFAVLVFGCSVLVRGFRVWSIHCQGFFAHKKACKNKTLWIRRQKSHGNFLEWQRFETRWNARSVQLSIVRSFQLSNCSVTINRAFEALPIPNGS